MMPAGRKWKSGGNESTPANTDDPAKPLKVAAKKGNPRLSSCRPEPLPRHFLYDAEPGAVENGHEAEAQCGLEQIDDFGLYGTDVDTPQELARFEVIQDIATAPAFQCTVAPRRHGGVVGESACRWIGGSSGDHD